MSPYSSQYPQSYHSTRALSPSWFTTLGRKQASHKRFAKICRFDLLFNPYSSAKGKKSKARQKIQATSDQIQALYAKPENILKPTYNADAGAKKEVPVWVAPHPKSGVKGNLVEGEIKIPLPTPGLSWADCSPDMSPVMSPTDVSEVVSPSSPFPRAETANNQDSLVDTANIAELSLCPNIEDDEWEVRAEAVIVFESKAVTEELSKDGALVQSYSWDAEEDPKEQPPLCPHHRAGCKRKVCLVYEKLLREWEKNHNKAVAGNVQTSAEEIWNSDNDDDFTRIPSAPRGRYRGRGRGRGFRGFRGGRGRAHTAGYE